VKVVEVRKGYVHAALVKITSGQLRFLGSSIGQRQNSASDNTAYGMNSGFDISRRSGKAT
jgi:hypothetical protein